MEFTFGEEEMPDLFKLEGDLNNVTMMSFWDASFARPSIIKVCADEQYVYGLQLTLKTYKP